MPLNLRAHRFKFGFVTGATAVAAFLLLPAVRESYETGKRPEIVPIVRAIPSEPELAPNPEAPKVSKMGSLSFGSTSGSPANQAAFLLRMDRDGAADETNATIDWMLGEHIVQLRPQYESLLRSLGLDEQRVETIANAEEAVYRAKMIAHYAEEQMAQAFGDYDRLAQEVLGDRYVDYLAWETERPVLSEMRSILRFFDNAGRPQLTDSEQATLAELIRDTQAFSRGTYSNYFGPYHYSGRPAQGRMAKVIVGEANDLLSVRSGRLMEKAAASSLTPSAMETLADYFSAQESLVETRQAQLRELMQSRMQSRSQP